jgi:hypothetical protein
VPFKIIWRHQTWAPRCITALQKRRELLDRENAALSEKDRQYLREEWRSAILEPQCEKIAYDPGKCGIGFDWVAHELFLKRRRVRRRRLKNSSSPRSKTQRAHASVVACFTPHFSSVPRWASSERLKTFSQAQTPKPGSRMDPSGKWRLRKATSRLQHESKEE